MLRRYRVVIAKPGLDGHDRGAKVIARALRDAGFEVVYTGLFQTAELVAEAALQEDADAVGLSVLSGAHMTLIPKIVDELRARDLDDVLVFAGGIIPDEDRPALAEAGVAAVFTPGAPLGDIVDWLETTLDSQTSRSGDSSEESPRLERTQEQFVDLFEYQGKQLFARYGIPVSAGDVAATVDEAVRAADAAGYPVVVKAQVQVGGRGKAGGIKLAATADEVRTHAGAILGMDIKGHIVKWVWVEHASDIAEEYYASFTLDRSAKKYLGMLSAQGGVEIETVAEENPDAIARITIDPVDGLTEAACRTWVAQAKLNPAATDGAVDILLKLFHAYVDGDADLVEINPLILTPEGKVHALDAKVSLDENARFRHPEWDELQGLEKTDAREFEAAEKGLQYVGLEGTVGVIANGAGLAMATCDIVHEVGGRPANFLDIGGGASAQVMANALEVINNDPAVRAIFINIFGGITKGEEVANGIVQALSQVEIASPIVIRLDGTNAEEGRAILSGYESDRLVSRPTMVEAARTAVEMAEARS